MTSSSIKLFLFAVLLVGFLNACTPLRNLDEADFWQRANTSEAAYTDGPKVQQMLNRDIARCVTELRELERIGVIKEAIPTDRLGRHEDVDKKELSRLDDVSREGYLLAEHRPYRDFESCMHAKGWERVAYLPYNVVDRGYQSYDSSLNESLRMRKNTNQNSTKNASDYQVNQ